LSDTIFCKKGKGGITIRASCPKIVIPWLCGLLSFVPDGSIVYEQDEEKADLVCAFGGYDRMPEGKVIAVHEYVGKPESPFSVWAEGGCDCMVTGASGDVWKLVGFAMDGQIIEAYPDGLKDWTVFRTVLEKIKNGDR